MTLSAQAVTEAAIELARRRKAGLHGPRLPQTCRPADLTDGLGLQPLSAPEARSPHSFYL